jgi:hypothetical protein
MDGRQRINGFDFQNQLVLDNEVSAEGARERESVLHERGDHFSSERPASPAHFMGKTGSVDRL